MCWWPVLMWPNLDLPVWSPFILIALLSAFGTILTGGLWFRSVFASVAGTVAGSFGGTLIWPPVDSEGASFLPVGILIAAALAAAVSLVAGFAAAKLSVTGAGARRLIWTALGLCVATGPIEVVLTPRLIAHRVAQNDRLAAYRFASLKNAAERTAAQDGGPDKICDGEALKQNYVGPAFTDADWKRIEGNYVGEDGYMFGIWCHQQGGYIVDVTPSRGKADGSKSFCADELGRVGCGIKWVRVRETCAPCS
jgi:hypothetical protein